MDKAYYYPHTYTLYYVKAARLWITGTREFEGRSVQLCSGEFEEIIAQAVDSPKAKKLKENGMCQLVIQPLYEDVTQEPTPEELEEFSFFIRMRETGTQVAIMIPHNNPTLTSGFWKATHFFPAAKEELTSIAEKIRFPFKPRNEYERRYDAFWKRIPEPCDAILGAKIIL